MKNATNKAANKFANKSRRTIVIIASAIVILLVCPVLYFFSFMFPYRGTVKSPEYSKPLEETLTKKQAAEDLKYFVKHLKDYHPAYLDGSDDLTNAVQKQYETELISLGENVTVLQLWQAAASIASKLHDGHTGVSYNNPNDDHFVSNFAQFYEYGMPIAINGIKAEDILNTFKSRYSYEMEAHVENVFYNRVIASELYLNYCGVDTSDGVTFTYQTSDGPVDFDYDFVTSDNIIGYRKETADKWVSYHIDKDNNLAIFTLLECKYNKEYLSVLKEFFKEVKENQITNIAVDLRGNGGGNSNVANAFLEYIDIDQYYSLNRSVRYGWYLSKDRNVVCKNRKKDVVFSGNIYVLTNVRTYSAAMDFAMMIKDNNIGKIIGTASGNMPNSYGDILDFQMPNSKLCFTISYKKWYRIDKTKAEEALAPDYETDPGKALDKVYELIKEQI